MCYNFLLLFKELAEGVGFDFLEAPKNKVYYHWTILKFRL